MNRSSRNFLVWLLSLCMIIMPLSGIAHARVMSKHQDSGIMPCHQASANTDQQICPETGLPGCDCCDFAVPAGLTSTQTAPGVLLYVTLIHQESSFDSYLSQPQSPPYRPPRLSI